MTYLESIWAITVEAAPWLLFGFLAAATIKAWVPTHWITRQLGRRGAGSVIKASVVGIPLPLCSCGVLPTALGLRRQGASRSSTSAFLVSTPEIGLDSFALSFVLLGPAMAISRPIAALFSALTAGFATLTLGDRDEPETATDRSDAASCGQTQSQAAATASCCGTQDKPQATPGCRETAVASAAASNCCEVDDRSQTAQTAPGCCASTTTTDAEPGSCCEPAHIAATALDQATGSALQRLGEGLAYVFSRLLDDIKWWLAIALVVAGVAIAATGGEPAAVLAAWGHGPMAMLVMLVIGIPLYVCATASTPIAAALLIGGVSPGTVLVLLLAGPATNLGAIAILRRELGTRTVVVYVAAVAVIALVSGLVVDAVFGAMGIVPAAQIEHARHLIPHWVGVGSAVLLIALAISPLRNRLFALFQRSARNDGASPSAAAARG